MVLPKECKMPDLSSVFSGPILGQLMVQLLLGEPGLSREFKLYRRNYIRLLRKAAYEYKQARETILEWISDHQNLNLPSLFTNHMENCINSISRILKLMYRMKSDKAAPNIPEETRKSLEKQFDSFREFRNTIEHIDEVISKGEISKGNPVMLVLNSNHDGVVISNLEIKFNDIVNVLKKSYELAPYILTVKKVDTLPQP